MSRNCIILCALISGHIRVDLAHVPPLSLLDFTRAAAVGYNYIHDRARALTHFHEQTELQPERALSLVRLVRPEEQGKV